MAAFLEPQLFVNHKTNVSSPQHSYWTKDVRDEGKCHFCDSVSGQRYFAADDTDRQGKFSITEWLDAVGDHAIQKHFVHDNL